MCEWIYNIDVYMCVIFYKSNEIQEKDEAQWYSDWRTVLQHRS